MMFEIYTTEETEAYEILHIQTKQFKDDIKGQISSAQGTIALVANLASELYEKNVDFSLVFESYEPTGLISNVGILQPDNTFVTKKDILNFNSVLSFEDEAAKGKYISGRVTYVTNTSIEIIRIAEPIIVKDEIVGILYGSINLDNLEKRYSEMVSDLDAQLFIYESQTGNFIIDTISSKLGNIIELKNRKYSKGYSYEKLVSEDKGYSAKIPIWNLLKKQ